MSKKLDARRVLSQRTFENRESFGGSVEAAKCQRCDGVRLVRIQLQCPPRQDGRRVEHLRTAGIGHDRQRLRRQTERIRVTGVPPIRMLELSPRPFVFRVRRRRILLVDALAPHDGGESPGIVGRPHRHGRQFARNHRHIQRLGHPRRDACLDGEGVSG